MTQSWSSTGYTRQTLSLALESFHDAKDRQNLGTYVQGRRVSICEWVCVCVCAYTRWRTEAEPTFCLPSFFDFRLSLAITIQKYIWISKPLDFTLQHNQILLPFLFAQRAFTTICPEGIHMTGTQDNPQKNTQQTFLAPTRLSRVGVTEVCDCTRALFFMVEVNASLNYNRYFC